MWHFQADDRTLPIGRRSGAPDLVHLRDVIRVLVMRDQKSRYKSTTMGVVWAVASPVLFLLTFWLMFQVILPLDVPNYASHVFIGIVAWIWFQSTAQEAVRVITSNASLVSQPRFPNEALPLASTLSNLVTLLLTCPVLALLILLDGAQLGATLLALPLLLLIQFLFVLATAFFVAALNVSFRDMQYMVPILLQLGYFTTPIFYDLSLLSEEGQRILWINPMLHVIEGYRSVLIRGEWPDWAGLAYVLVGSCVFLALAFRYFRRASMNFLEAL